jgi:homoserine dehydrogenase
MKEINIGLFGFGVVGEGIYTLLNESKQVKTSVKHICIKDAHKARNAPAELFSTDADQILSDGEIDLVVELISDADAAYDIITRALTSGKSVVSANKRIIAEKLPELIALAKANNASFLYEAAVCASIPILRNLEEYFDNDWLKGLKGIVNGSTNFIFTQIKNAGLDYNSALKLAQENGFAEEDSRLDVEGFDAAFKLSILAKHAFGLDVNPYDLFRVGITKVSAFDAQYAKEKNLVIKLVAYANSNDDKEIELAVCPTFIPLNDKLASIDNEYNAVIVNSAFNTEQFFSGKGAGRFPTASAVLSDISAFSYQYRYEYKKSKQSVYKLSNENEVSKWYLRSSKGTNFDEITLEKQEHYSTNNNSYAIVKASILEIKELQKKYPLISIIKF